MPSILVVDDYENIRKLIETYLIRGGYKVFLASDGLAALAMLEKVHIDLIIADVMMPGMDGFSLTRELRTSGCNLPVLIITAKDSIEDKISGFGAGTDDYMVKPIDFNEMLLRVAALLRRAKIASEHRIEVGHVILDQDTLTVQAGMTRYELPKKEFQLLFKLLSYPSKIFTRQNLMDEIWGPDYETDERTVDVHVKRLRDKFDHLAEFKIITIRGLGYKIERNM
jgi:two-component system, OmpR family, response regulator